MNNKQNRFFMFIICFDPWVVPPVCINHFITRHTRALMLLLWKARRRTLNAPQRSWLDWLVAAQTATLADTRSLTDFGFFGGRFGRKLCGWRGAGPRFKQVLSAEWRTGTRCRFLRRCGPNWPSWSWSYPRVSTSLADSAAAAGPCWEDKPDQSLSHQVQKKVLLQAPQVQVHIQQRRTRFGLLGTRCFRGVAPFGEPLLFLWIMQDCSTDIIRNSMKCTSKQHIMSLLGSSFDLWVLRVKSPIPFAVMRLWVTVNWL